MSNKQDKEELSDVEEETTLTDSDVLSKYKEAAEIATGAIQAIIKECTPGKKIVDLCLLGDKFVTDKLAGMYNKGKVEKGIAFPTSISVNNCLGHFSPLNGDNTVLADGDVAKIDIGVHISGYISLAAHTIIVSETTTTPTPVTGRKADVICAAHYAAECAHRLIKPGKKNTDVTEMIKKVAAQFKVEPVEGVLSHQMKRFVVDGNQTIINRATIDHKVEEFEFEENQVYAVDIVMSTGEGKAREMETKTTIYKRAIDQTYQLKMQASRYVLNEITQKFPTLPFSLRSLDEKRGKLGISECVKHDLVVPYPTLYEKAGEFVAQFKFTVLILPSQTSKLNSLPLPYVQSEHKIVDPEITALLQQGTKRTSKNKNKKKKSKKPKSEGTEAPKDDAMVTN